MHQRHWLDWSSQFGTKQGQLPPIEGNHLALVAEVIVSKVRPTLYHSKLKERLTEEFHEPLKHALDLVVPKHETKVPDMHDVVPFNQVLWNILSNIPVVKDHVWW